LQALYRLITTTTGFNEELDVGSRVLLQKLDKFCYLRDVLNEAGRCDSAVTARVRSVWKKFREYSVLTYSNRKGILVKIERQSINE